MVGVELNPSYWKMGSPSSWEFDLKPSSFNSNIKITWYKHHYTCSKSSLRNPSHLICLLQYALSSTSPGIFICQICTQQSMRLSFFIYKKILEHAYSWESWSNPLETPIKIPEGVMNCDHMVLWIRTLNLFILVHHIQWFYLWWTAHVRKPSVSSICTNFSNHPYLA